MMISTQPKIFSSLTLATCLHLMTSTSQAAQPGANASAEAAFLKAIPAHANLAQIKKLLPRGTKYSPPRWEQLYGNCITVRGKITGKLWFISQRKKRQSYDDETHLNQEKYRPSDWINHVELVMDNGKLSSKTDTKRRIEAVRRVLGKPGTFAYIKDTDPGMLPGWYAEWTLSKQRFIHCYTDYGHTGREATILSLTLPNQWQGAG